VALRSAIERLLADRELRRALGSAGRATARERFSSEAAIEATIRAYRDALT
jgi:glycosyltransferase involved in cell wall biosynthesis